jgi:predicted amidohydrolase
MRLLLAQLAPVPGEPERNVARIADAVGAAPSDLAIFPELFLTGYRIGDRFHTLALRDGDGPSTEMARIARDGGTTLVVGAAVASPERRGEVENAAVVVRPDGSFARQTKRYLPTFGPFEEGAIFTPTETSHPLPAAGHRVGLEICYDLFFPEVSRELGLGDAELLVGISSSPVTSRSLFERVLPARAIENSLPLVFVNRVGVEDGIVFGGGTGAWDARGERLAGTEVPLAHAGEDERLERIDLDLAASARWRPFRPVLRDVATRPPVAPGA